MSFGGTDPKLLADDIDLSYSDMRLEFSERLRRRRQECHAYICIQSIEGTVLSVSLSLCERLCQAYRVMALQDIAYQSSSLFIAVDVDCPTYLIYFFPLRKSSVSLD